MPPYERHPDRTYRATEELIHLPTDDDPEYHVRAYRYSVEGRDQWGIRHGITSVAFAEHVERVGQALVEQRTFAALDAQVQRAIAEATAPTVAA